MWAFGVCTLRLSEETFWRLTIAQYNALTERYKEDERARDYRAALITSVIAEVNRDRKKRGKPYRPSDFMPQEKPKGKMNSAKTNRVMKRINQLLGGTEA